MSLALRGDVNVAGEEHLFPGHSNVSCLQGRVCIVLFGSSGLKSRNIYSFLSLDKNVC